VIRASLDTRCIWRAERLFTTGHTEIKGSWLPFRVQRPGVDVPEQEFPSGTHPNPFVDESPPPRSARGARRELAQPQNVTFVAASPRRA
jgi:hypothetical protein